MEVEIRRIRADEGWRPAIRGAGIGAGLVRAVVEWARAGGARHVELWVVADNDPAIALYSALRVRDDL